MGKKKRRNRLMDPFSPNYKMFCYQGEPQTLSHQKFDAIFFLTRLKGRNIFGLCFLRLNCVILDLDRILGFWGGLGFLALVFILGHPTPKALTTILAGSLRRLEEVENLGFLENSRICKSEEERFPLGTLYIRRNLVRVNPLEIQKKKKKKETKNYRRDESRSISNETLHRWIHIVSSKQGTWIYKNLMKANLVYRNIKIMAWIVEKTPCSQEWWKMGAKGQLSHRDPPFPLWSKKKESWGAIVGVNG